MKAALITGAGRGFGEALAGSLLQRGYRVFGLVRTAEAADKLRLRNSNAGTGASLDSLRPGLEDEVAAQLDVHCIGALRITLAGLPHLRRASDALIVNVSSRFGSTSRPAAGVFAGRKLSYAYPIAKAAQNMF